MKVRLADREAIGIERHINKAISMRQSTGGVRSRKRLWHQGKAKRGRNLGRNEKRHVKAYRIEDAL
jgi:hypothetical protein